MILYGIANCDSVKKARAYLALKGVEFNFHDYKKQGLTPELLDVFCAHFSWQELINKRGTSWRALPDDIKNTLDEKSAKTLILDNPSLIKRPLILGEGIAILSLDSVLKHL